MFTTASFKKQIPSRKISTFLTLGLLAVTANAAIVRYDFNSGMAASTSGGDLTASSISYAVGTQSDANTNNPGIAARTWDDNKASGDYSLLLGQRGIGNSSVEDGNLTTTGAATLQFTLTPNVGESLDFSVAELRFDQSVYVDENGVAYGYKVWADSGSGFVAVGDLQDMNKFNFTDPGGYDPLGTIYDDTGTGSDLFETDEITDSSTSKLLDGIVQSQELSFIFDLSSLGELSANQSVTFAIAMSSSSNNQNMYSSTLDNIVVDFAPIHGYDEWSASLGLTGGETDDEDGDGLSNLLEFSAGGSPNQSGNRGYRPVVGMKEESGTNWMHYDHVRRTYPADALKYVLEETQDLTSGEWTTANFEEVSSVRMVDDPDFEQVAQRIAVSGGHKFFRLRTEVRVPLVYEFTSPPDLGDGIEVGTFDMLGAQAAVDAFIADDEAGKYEKLDSLLIWKDGKLIFERYSRDGRIDEAHYMMSVTKTMTSVVLARAIQLGHLDMDDLDAFVIDFMPELDRSTLQTGVDTITLRDALLMQSGMVFPEEFNSAALVEQKQAYWQQIFENTAPVTPESKVYKYTGINPEMILMILDIQIEEGIANFIKTELGDNMGADFTWSQNHGFPVGGAGSNFTSRFLIKVGVALFNGGMHDGQQWLSPEYVQMVMDTSKGDGDGTGYYYYFHNRKRFGSSNVNYISGVGAGGQYMSIYPKDNLVISATSDHSTITGPLTAIEEHFAPLLMTIE